MDDSAKSEIDPFPSQYGKQPGQSGRYERQNYFENNSGKTFKRIQEIPGAAAKVLNQGSSLTCTCQALANAIADKLNEEHNIDVNQESLADILVNNNQHLGAVWPHEYDNYPQRILLMDRNSKEEEKKWISIKIKTVKEVNKFINGEKHLLSYISKNGHHCVFLKEQIGDLYKCVNSWGEKESYPLVPVENPGNKLWIVRIEFELAPNSNNAVDETTLQESDQELAENKKYTEGIKNVKRHHAYADDGRKDSKKPKSEEVESHRLTADKKPENVLNI